MPHRSSPARSLAIGLCIVAIGACSSPEPVDEGAGGTVPATARPPATATPGTTTPPGGTQLTIGLLVPTSGELASLGGPLEQTVESAIADINDAGGVNGAPVLLVTADEGSTPESAEEGFAELLEAGADVVIGPASSSSVRALAGDLAAARVPVCSGSATAADLATLDTGRTFFRTAPSDEYQAAALASLLDQDGHRRVAVIARGDDYGVGFSQRLGAALDRRGIEVTAQVAYDPDADDVSAEVTEARDSNPAAVAVIGRLDDGSKVLAELAAQGSGPSALPTYASDALQDPGLGALVDPENPAIVEGVQGTAPATRPGREGSPFPRTDVGADPAPYAAYYWDCTNLLALAVGLGESADPASVRASLERAITGDVLCGTFADCREALDAGETVHYRGASNPFDRWSGMQPDGGQFDVWALGPDGTIALAENRLYVDSSD